MGDNLEVKKQRETIRFITYLKPNLSQSLFDCVAHYLETVLNANVYLIVESRWSGPPVGQHYQHRPDPFTADIADIGWMTFGAYMTLREEVKDSFELCRAAPVFSHRRITREPVCYSDIVVHINNKDRFKEFDDLKGCRWAYNDEFSMSGNTIMLAELKKHGYNSTFFGSIHETGSNVNSLARLLAFSSEATCIDSNSLAAYKQKFPERSENLHVMASLGPMPAYPIVFNSKLSGAMKYKITDALLNLTTNPEWCQRFLNYGIEGFATVDDSFYERMYRNITKIVSDISMQSTYY